MAYNASTEAATLSQFLKAFMLQSFGILSFECAKYSWYVKMYIGLFLLIPYLNILYNGLQNQKQKQYLILTLLLLSGIPDTVNGMTFSFPWTMTYNDPATPFLLLPNWWTFCYPITFYFLGAYLSEYPLNLSRRKNLMLILLFMVFSGSVIYLLNAGKEFLYATWQETQSLFSGVQAVLVFNFLANLDLTHLSGGKKKLLACLSDLSFCAYLVSSVFDDCFYPIFTRNSGLLIHKPQYFLVLVPLVAGCSLVTSYLLVSFYKLISGNAKKHVPVQ